jgi:hypothetical protein
MFFTQSLTLLSFILNQLAAKVWIHRRFSKLVFSQELSETPGGDWFTPGGRDIVGNLHIFFCWKPIAVKTAVPFGFCSWSFSTTLLLGALP